ncbi:MAG: hypothetical protein ABTQ73_11655 [Caldilineales bacterium]
MALAKLRRPASPRTTSGPATRGKGMLILLAGLLALSLIVGIAALMAYFYLDTQHVSEWRWQDPLTAVDSSRVRPDLAALALLDQPAGVVAQQAVLAKEPDTAYAVLVYALAISDATRSGSIGLVAKEFDALALQDLAAISYQQMQDLAALSPAMPDPMRAQVSLDAARGFIENDLPDAARPALQQAETLARYSPLIAPVQRQDIARQLQSLYRTLGDDTAVAALDQLVRQPRGLPTNKFVRGPFLSAFVGDPATPPELQAASEARKTQIVAFLQAWDSADPSRLEAARNNLAAALLAEDRLRSELLPTRDSQDAPLPQRTALMLDHVRWLGYKFMIAGGAAGDPLVPQWHNTRAEVAAELLDAENRLFALYRDQASRLPDADDALAARVEILRQQILLGRLGLYPGFDEEAQARALDELQRQGGDILPLLVVRDDQGGGYGAFRLSETFE